MAEPRPRPGRHKARHKAPTAFERTCTRLGDGVRSLPRPVAVTVVSGGLLAASAVAAPALLDESPVTASTASAGTTTDTDPTDVPAAAVAERADEPGVSRAGDRPSLAELKARELDASGPGRHVGRTTVTHEAIATSESDPRDIARAMLAQHGWSESEFTCLDELYVGESNWEWDADNPTSSAYGIPQALPGEKMAAAGPDWLTNPATQIEWGLTYIAERYGTPCEANAFKNANNWY